MKRIALAMSIAVAGCEVQIAEDGPTCSQEVTKTIAVDTPATDPPLQYRIESCRLDVDACGELCVELTQRESLPRPISCSVKFEPASVEAKLAFCGGGL